MQPLPANGQAQPLPEKWVIKRTPENAEMVNKWANENCAGIRHDYWNRSGFIYCEKQTDSISGNTLLRGSLIDGYELITDAQFKAMVEGEAKPARQSCIDIHYVIGQVHDTDPVLKARSINAILVWAGEDKMAEEHRAKHPDIWPVDYAAIVLEKAVAWYEDLPVQNNQQDCELRYAVRNYLTNQK